MTDHERITPSTSANATLPALTAMKRFREDVYALRFAAISPAASLLVRSARFVALC